MDTSKLTQNTKYLLHAPGKYWEVQIEGVKTKVRYGRLSPGGDELSMRNCYREHGTTK